MERHGQVVEMADTPSTHPNRDTRLAEVGAALEAAGLDALIVTHNRNLLLLTGFWPVTGASVAIVARTGEAVQVEGRPPPPKPFATRRRRRQLRDVTAQSYPS